MDPHAPSDNEAQRVPGSLTLPVVADSPWSDPGAMHRAVLRSVGMLASTLGEAMALEGVACYASESYPTLLRGNVIVDPPPGSGDEAAEVLAAWVAHWRGVAADRGGVLRVALPAGAEGAALGAIRERVDCVVTPAVLLRASGEAAEPASQAWQVIPARSASGEVRRLAESEAATWPAEEPAADPSQWAAARVEELDEGRLDAWVARREGEPRALAGVVSLGQVGVIWTWTGTDPDAVRGLRSTVWDHARRAGYHALLAWAAAGSPRLALYRELGFEQVSRFAWVDVASRAAC